MPRILIIDDDTELCGLLEDFLRLEGFDTAAVHNGTQAIEHCGSNSYDAIVLDIMLPGTQGLDVLRQLRTFTDTPVLMLTARGEDTDRILGLELGADDYLPKPCNPRELSARLRAILRRTGSDGNGVDGRATSGRGIAARQRPQGKLTVGQTCIDAANRHASFNGDDLQLTSAEFNILALLVAQAGAVVSKDTLSEKALGRPLTAYDRSIDVHVSKIRKKMSALGGDDLIVSIRGVGYQFRLETAATPPE